MQSVDGYDRPYFDNAVLEYDFYLVDIPSVYYTLVYGLISGSTEKKQDFRVTATLQGRVVYAGKINMYPETREASTDERMYWELLLPTTEDMSVGAHYEIIINNGSTASRAVKVKIPKVDAIEFEDLVTTYTYDPNQQ